MPDNTGIKGVILLAEDLDVLRKLLQTVLEKAGYTVLSAPCGADAIIIAASFIGPIDLFLSDLVMPQISGPSAAAILLVDRPKMLVLFMSGHDSRVIDGVLQALPKEASFIAKPFLLSELLEKIAGMFAEEDSSPKLGL